MKRLAPLLIVFACERYEAPPEPMIVGLGTGVLDDPRAPIVVNFGTAIDPATMNVTLAYNETDIEGDLFDEDADPATVLHPLATTAMLNREDTEVTLTPAAVIPVGPKLVLLFEAGLKSASGGRTSNHRVKIPFSYGVKCTGGTSRLASGTYFMLLDVKQPVGVQIQILATLTIDPTNGTISGQFTNADRKTDQTCPTACTGGTLCRLLPKPACVLPSELAGTADEYPDWFAFSTPPTGYSFIAEGCAADSVDGTGVLTAPATMVVESPPVTVEGLTMTASFAPDANGIVRANGTLTADEILLGGSPIGPGKGTMTARLLQ